MRPRHLFLIALVGAVTTGCRGCGARGGLPPAAPPLAPSADGVERHVVDHGEYKAYYDAWGRLERIEQDSNGDGRPDRVSHHVGQKQPQLIEIDQDFDGLPDRWEYYDPGGKLVRVGASRRGNRVPDTWVYRDAQGKDHRREYDDDGDGRPERAEVLVNGHVARTEVDSDRDGKFDRWQDWSGGHLIGEDLDTDADGKADRHVTYDSQGRPVALKPAS